MYPFIYILFISSMYLLHGCDTQTRLDRDTNTDTDNIDRFIQQESEDAAPSDHSVYYDSTMNHHHTDMNQVDHDMNSSPLDMEIIINDMNPPQDLSGLPDAEVDPLHQCIDDLVPSLTWFTQPSDTLLQGEFEFAQTHVIRANETRLAPPLITHRETLLLFTPQSHFTHDVDMRVAIFRNEEQLGVLRMNPPDMMPDILEQQLTHVDLHPYSTQAWSTTLPWYWIQSDITLRIGVVNDHELSTINHSFTNLGAPHRFTLTRTHMVLFGDDDFQINPPQTSAKIAMDMSSWVPGAELRWVNTSPWRLHQVVVNTSDGPRWARSESERTQITNDSTRWNIIKHQGALRLSLANTGRGLYFTGASQGDHSPYSFGTSMLQGWVRQDDGSYVDVNNAGLAAGWTGWSGMWLNECGNGFIHEVGHSFTLAHFNGNSAVNWGISDEYPNNGVHLSTHPWGYDTVRRKFRTWYRVNANGPVVAEDGTRLIGKNDPMNGGESANTITCFPQYTAYQMKQSQAWLQNTPTLLNIDGTPGIYRWHGETQRYIQDTVTEEYQAPIAIDIPVMSLIGTLGNIDEVCQTYPPVHIPEGNAFQLPDPQANELPGYEGAEWFLEITYADQSIERALINRARVDANDRNLYLYSVNIEASKNPISVKLYRSSTAYPNIDLDNATLIHTRLLEAAIDEAKPVLKIGKGQLTHDELHLTQWCDTGYNCMQRLTELEFHESIQQVSFTSTQNESTLPTVCNTQGSYATWRVPVVSDTGERTQVMVHAQRILEAQSHQIEVAAYDQTPWLSIPNMKQKLRLWIPYSENQQLSAGVYQTEESFWVSVLKDGSLNQQVPLQITLTIHHVENIDLPPSYLSDGLTIPSSDPISSIYYIFEDSTMGPSHPQWWGDSTGNLVYVPVLDQDGGESTQLTLRAHKIACGDWWGINTGQAADWGCTHQVHLQLEPEANQHLVAGHTYSSPGSQPVIIKGVRWHEPNAGQILGTLALDITHHVQSE